MDIICFEAIDNNPYKTIIAEGREYGEYLGDLQYIIDNNIAVLKSIHIPQHKDKYMILDKMINTLTNLYRTEELTTKLLKFTAFDINNF